MSHANGLGLCFERALLIAKKRPPINSTDQACEIELHALRPVSGVR